MGRWFSRPSDQFASCFEGLVIQHNLSGQFPTGLGVDPKCMKLLRNYYARVVADFFRRQVPVLQALQVSCKTLRATLVSARCWGHDDCTLRDSTSNHRGTRPKPETAVSHPL